MTNTLSYDWHDEEWIENRSRTNHFQQPKNVYEVHLGSWKRHVPPEGDDSYEPPTERGDLEQISFVPGNEEGGGYFYSYRDLAKELIPYVKDMGYTHLEIMPVMD